MQKNYSSSKAVQQEIKYLTEKRDYLSLLLSLNNYKDCALMFSAFHEIEGRGFHFVRQEHFPFNMEQEFKMALADAIVNYDNDIAALKQHLNII